MIRGLKRLARRWKLWLGILAGLTLAMYGGFQVLVRTDWFEQKVRERFVAELERASGGRVEVEGFEFRPADLALDVKGLTIHGTEDPPAPPFVNIAALHLEIGIESLLAQKISLKSLRLVSPEVHVSVAEDGTSNVPGPAARPGVAESAIAQLLDLAVSRLQIDNGALHWKDVSYGLTLSAEQLRLETRHEKNLQRYVVSLGLGNSRLEVAGHRPVISRAEGKLFVYRDRIEGPDISISGEDYEVSVGLQASKLGHPEIALTYRLEAPVEPWAAWLKTPYLKGGEAQVSGEAEWKPTGDQLAYSGRLSVSRLRAENSELAVDPIAVTGHYQGDQKRLAMKELEISAAGGRFLGELAVENPWAGGRPRVRLQGDLEGLGLRGVLALWKGSQIGGLARTLPWTSGISGWLRAEGSGSEDLEAALSLILSAPEAPAPGRVPLEGVVDIAYDGPSRRIDVPRLDLVTSGSEISAEGSLAADGRPAVNLRARFRALDDLLALASLSGAHRGPPPLLLRGEASLEGRLEGRYVSPAALEFDGSVAADDFQLLGYDWDHFQGQVSFGQEGLKVTQGRFEDGAAWIDVNFDLPLREGELVRDQPLSGRIELQDLPVGKLLAAAGRPEAVTGRLRATASLGGTPSAPQGSADFTVVDGTAWREPFERLSGRLVVSGERVVAPSLELVRGAGRVAGTLEFSRAERRFQFSARGSDWRLEGLDLWGAQQRRPGGTVGFHLTGGGRLGATETLFEDLQLSGAWKVEQVAFGERPLGTLAGQVATEDGEIALQWQGNLLAGEVQGKARVRPADGLALRGDLEFRKMPPLELFRLLDLPVEAMEGEVDGNCEFSGSLSQPLDFEAQGLITRLEVGLSEIPGAKRGYKLYNPFPLRWDYTGRKLHLDQMRLLGDGTDLVIDGEIPLEDEQQIELSIGGTFNLAVLGSFRSELQAGGSSALKVTIAGSIDEPTVRGRMELQNASLRSEDFPNGLSQVQGVVRFDRKRLRIEKLTAASGGGVLRLNGTALYGGEATSYRFSATAEHVRLRYPANLSSTVDGQLTFSGTGLRSLLGGEISVRRVVIPKETDLGSLMAALGEPARTPPSNPLLQNMQFDVQISSVPGLPIDTSIVRNIEAEIDLQLLGTAVNPSLTGNVNVTQGEMEFQGSRYTINRGDIAFVNPFRLEPVLNFELETRIRDVDIALTLSGPARKLNVNYRSDPPLQFNELVALVAVGRTPTTDPVLASQQSVQQQHLTQIGANAVLSQALSRPVSKGLQRFFGVSRLKVDPQISGAEDDPGGARISTEQQITSDLTLIYSYNSSSVQRQTVRLEWAPSRRWSFVVTRDENGLVGADLLYKKRLR